MSWKKVDTQILDKDFEPNNPKDNKAILVIYSIIIDNEIISKYTRILGTPEPPYDMPITLVSFLGSTNQDGGFKAERIKLDVDFHNLMDNKLYTIEIENYDKKYGFIYRPDKHLVEQYEGDVI